MKSVRALLCKVRFELPPTAFKVWNGGNEEFTGPNLYTEATKEELMKWHKDMVTIRRLETKCSQLYTQKKIRGFCHLYTGQEAICVGAESSMTYDDAIITAYREHGWNYTRGGTVEEMVAEQMGKIGGGSKGKGGSMHFYNTKNHFYGGNGIVGAQCPVGTGVAFRFAYDNNEKPTGICLTLYGDGAANQGQLYEAMNMAAMWNLPVVFACENNLFAMGTSLARGSAQSEFYNRITFLPGLWVDGMDILACREAMRYVKEWQMAGKGPVCVEFHSYRYMGHSMSDPGTSYRTRDDVQKVKEDRDCITKFTNRLVKEGLTTEEEIKAIEKATNKETDKQVAAGEAHPNTPLSELHTDVYAEPGPVRGVSHNVQWGA